MPYFKCRNRIEPVYCCRCDAECNFEFLRSVFFLSIFESDIQVLLATLTSVLGQMSLPPRRNLNSRVAFETAQLHFKLFSHI